MGFKKENCITREMDKEEGRSGKSWWIWSKYIVHSFQELKEISKREVDANESQMDSEKQEKKSMSFYFFSPLSLVK